MAELYSEAQPDLFQSWGLQAFERVFESFRRMEDEEIFGIRRKFVSSENPLWTKISIQEPIFGGKTRYRFKN